MRKLQSQGVHHITRRAQGRQHHNIGQVHLADAIEALVARSSGSLSEDRSAKAAYQR